MFIFSALNAQTQVRCVPGDTPRHCVQLLIAMRAYDETQDALASTNTGIGALALPARSAVKDFLSAASAHIYGSSVKDSGTSLVLDYNFLKLFNLEGVFPDPVVSPGVAASTTTPEQLSRGDDVITTLSYNLLTRHFGRDVDRALFDSILLALISNTPPATATVPATAYDTPFVQLFPDAAARVTAMAEYETTAIAMLQAPAAKQLEGDVAALANNQPQLFISALYHHRAIDVGPDERGLRLTWEIGNENTNTFRSLEGRDCESRGDCLAAITNFAARTAKRHRTGRLALAIQYGKSALNNPSVGGYSEAATNGLSYMATYGMEVSGFTGQPTRFDIAYTYDGKKATHNFTTGNPVKMPLRGSTLAARDIAIPPSRIRDSAAFTITQPVARNLYVPVSVIIATHDDWLPPVSGFPISFPLPSSIPPRHLVHRETSVEAGIRFVLPAFRHPSPNPACCCR
jgi:hypothetical protein